MNHFFPNFPDSSCLLSKKKRHTHTHTHTTPLPGGLSHSLGLALPTGGLIDLQSLVYAWIFNATGAYQLPSGHELPGCSCVDETGKETEASRMGEETQTKKDNGELGAKWCDG